jgi:small GTP-binding protein
MTGVNAKIVFLGDAAVGKTCIIQSFTEQAWNDHQQATIAAHYQQSTIYVDREPVVLRIWDTAGQERFRSLAPMYYRDSQVAVLVYAVDDQVSFDGLKDWMAGLNSAVASPPAVIIVGNKTDLDTRAVPVDVAERFAEDNAASYVETSAKVRSGIKELFMLAAQLVLKERHKAPVTAASTNLDVAAKGEKKKRGCCK